MQNHTLSTILNYDYAVEAGTRFSNAYQYSILHTKRIMRPFYRIFDVKNTSVLQQCQQVHLMG